MSKVALIDPNFKVIYDYLSNPQSDVTILTLSQNLQDLRKQINLNWYSKFLQYDHISYLAEIWDALFQLLADNISDDPGLRISIFKTLGALIFALSPFIPFTTVASFLSSIQNKPSSPHLSIAIIACFCHISQFVSPLNFDSFISKSPIVQYFSDLKQSTTTDHQPQNQSYYVKYLPKIISNVKPLNLEFQRFLLSSLLNTFGENPTLPFIFAILNLLKSGIDTTVLLDDLFQYIHQKKEQRQLTLLMISPYLLEEDKTEITAYLTEKEKDELFDLAVSIIQKNAPEVPSFSEFEQACRTLSALLDKESSSSKLDEQMPKIKDVLRSINCPSYLKICTYPFIDSIDELTPKDEDKLSVITAKLSALSNFLKRSPTIENFECILQIFISFLNTESREILTNVINAVNKCFSVITVDLITEKNDKQKVYEIQNDLRILLEKFLNVKTSNFVQNVAIANLIQSVKTDVGERLISNYKSISFHLVFNFCFSMHNNLSETAINVLKTIIQYKTVPHFISLLFGEIDFFDSFSLFKICEISNTLIEAIGYQTVNEFKSLIVPIFESLTLIHRTSDDFSKIIRTEAEAFCFLNKMVEILKSDECEFDFLNEKQINELKLISFDLISRIFESFTGIDPQLPTISPSIQPITSLVETDILLKSFDDQTYFLKALQECMIFLSFIQNRKKNQKEFSNDKFTELLIRLVKILPEETLKILTNLNNSFFINSDSYLVLLMDIMKTTNSVLVASQCALASSNSVLMEQQIKSFIQNQVQPQNLNKIKMYNFITKFINKKLIKNGRCKYNFLQYLKKVHRIYNDFISKFNGNSNSDSIENDQMAQLEIRLPEFELDSSQENVLFGFLEAEDRVSFIKSIEFDRWPLRDKEFSLFVWKNKEKLYPIQVKNYSSLTKDEIKFIASNREIFDQEVIQKVDEKFNDLYEKFFFEKNEIIEFNFEANLNGITKDSSMTSILPSLKKNSSIEEFSSFSIQFIKNFFTFQKRSEKVEFVLSNELFNKLLSLLIDDDSFDFGLIINYAIDNKIKIDFELIKKMLSKSCKYAYELTVYFSVISSNDDENCEQLKSLLLSTVSQFIKEKAVLKIECENSTEKSIVDNITNLTSIWPLSHNYCYCFDYDFYSHNCSEMNIKERILDANMILNSFDFFKELKSIQNSAYFKSTGFLKNSTDLFSQYFKYISQMNRSCKYQNSTVNQNFISMVQNFSKFLFNKAEFLVNSNFNQFSLNAENHSNLFYFFRLIEIYLQNIYFILKDDMLSEIKLKDEILNSVKKLIKSMVYFFKCMFDSDCLSYVIVHREVGRILSLIVLIDNLNENEKTISIDNDQVIEFINKVTSKSGIFSFSCFFECSSFLVLFSSLFADILKNNNGSIIQICKFNNLNTFVKIPSDSLAVLRSLMILVKPNLLKVLINSFYYVFYPSIVDVFRIYGDMKNPLVDIMIEKVVRRLLSNQDFNTIQNLVFPYLEKYAKDQVEKDKKNEGTGGFGVANRIISILDSAKVK